MKWYDVTEELPPYLLRVLLCDNNKYVYLGRRSEDGYQDDYKNELIDIKYWAPIPDAPHTFMVTNYACSLMLSPIRKEKENCLNELYDVIKNLEKHVSNPYEEISDSTVAETLLFLAQKLRRLEKLIDRVEDEVYG